MKLMKIILLIPFLLISLVTIFPTLYIYWPAFTRQITLLNKVTYPISSDAFHDFEKANISSMAGRNFYIEAKDKSRLGLWHIMPNEGEVKIKSGPEGDLIREKELGNGRPIVLYLHGNGRNRIALRRVQLYKKLSSYGYHVVALDYRGFGDSDGNCLEETDFVDDAHSAYMYIRSKAKNSDVILWGHSLGTGVVGSYIKFGPINDAKAPSAIVLEAPFTNMYDASYNHLLYTPFRYTGILDEMLRSALKRINFDFNNEENFKGSDIPILIMHAKDDFILPFHMGEKLATSLKGKTKSTVVFHEFPKGHGYYHAQILFAPEFPNVVKNFVHESVKKNQERLANIPKLSPETGKPKV